MINMTRKSITRTIHSTATIVGVSVTKMTVIRGLMRMVMRMVMRMMRVGKTLKFYHAINP